MKRKFLPEIGISARNRNLRRSSEFCRRTDLPPENGFYAGNGISVRNRNTPFCTSTGDSCTRARAHARITRTRARAHTRKCTHARSSFPVHLLSLPRSLPRNSPPRPHHQVPSPPFPSLSAFLITLGQRPLFRPLVARASPKRLTRRGRVCLRVCARARACACACARRVCACAGMWCVCACVCARACLFVCGSAGAPRAAAGPSSPSPRGGPCCGRAPPAAAAAAAAWRRGTATTRWPGTGARRVCVCARVRARLLSRMDKVLVCLYACVCVCV